MPTKYTLMLLEYLALGYLSPYVFKNTKATFKSYKPHIKRIMKMISNILVNSFLNFKVISLAVPSFKKNPINMSLTCSFLIYEVISCRKIYPSEWKTTT